VPDTTAEQATQECRDCHRNFPYDPEADYCPQCVEANMGEPQAGTPPVIRALARMLRELEETEPARDGEEG
jgi:hypothetical protein